jgi:hypothetical protein
MEEGPDHTGTPAPTSSEPGPRLNWFPSVEDEPFLHASPGSDQLGAEGARLHLGDSVLALLEPLQVRSEHLELYARTAPGNHPCTRFGGFDSAEQMATSRAVSPRLKGAVGWSDLEEMFRTELEQARSHGVGGLVQLEGIEDEVWRLSSKEPAALAVLSGHRIATLIDLTCSAVESATPLAPQTLVIEALRVYGWGALAGVELPRPAAVTLFDGAVIPRRERHVVVFPDRIELKAEKLGRFTDVIPRVSRRNR